MNLGEVFTCVPISPNENGSDKFQQDNLTIVKPVCPCFFYIYIDKKMV